MLVDPSGFRIPVSLALNPVQVGQAVAGSMVAIRDRTQQRDAERRLLHANEELQRAREVLLDAGRPIQAARLLNDEAAILAMEVMTGAEGLSRQSAEMVVCALLHMVDWMVGPSWQPAFVGFRHAPKLPLATYRKYLRLTPDFRQEFNGVGIDRADLDRPIDHAKERLERQVTEFIDAMSDETELYVYRVRQLLVLTLPRGEAQADVIAGYLRTTRRTLNRRLARAGLNFSALLEQVRREMAVQYGKGSDRPFSEIALLLGFESLAAFSRWFRRAFGATPSAWRRQHAE